MCHSERKERHPHQKHRQLQDTHRRGPSVTGDNVYFVICDKYGDGSATERKLLKSLFRCIFQIIEITAHNGKTVCEGNSFSRVNIRWYRLPVSIWLRHLHGAGAEMRNGKVTVYDGKREEIRRTEIYSPFLA